ncbi:MAG: ATP-binding protein [Methylotetracoccus sp.]
MTSSIFPKIESGRFQTHFEVVELQAFLNDLLLMIRPKAVGRGLSLELRIGIDGDPGGAPLPRYFELDTRALRQILVNLLGNAVKFTDRGGVTLRCYRHAADVQGRTCLRFEVEDTGIGIDHKDIERIFDDFHQADHAHASEGGTGLGLAISSRLARSLGGTLRVESQRGHGSRFHFDVQASPAPDSSRVTMPTSSTDLGSITGYRGPQRRILVIDDNPDNRRLLVDMLEPVGFHIETANDGEHGLEKAAAFRPDAVLCDLFMPKLDGFGFLARFRDHAPGIPVVAISASVHPASDEIERFGAFLRKPVDGGELFYTLGKLLGLRWDHQSPLGPDEAPDASGRSGLFEAAALPAPEPEVLARLIELAELGDIEGVKAVAASLEATHPRIASAVLNRAKRFQTEKLIEELRPMLSRHVD